MNNIQLERANVINDELRDAAFNRRYYGCLLAGAKRLNLTLDILVAIGTSAAVATWTIWQVGPGTIVWKVLAAGATLLSILKPFLNLPKEIERYSELVAGWAGVFYDLKQVTVRMRTSGAVTDAIWSLYEPTQHRIKELGVRDDPSAKKKLQRTCFAEIQHQMPSETLWWPEDNSDGRSGQVSETAATRP